MVARRTTAPRKRTAPKASSVVEQSLVAAEPARSPTSPEDQGVGKLVRAGMEQLQQRFQMILQGSADVDPEQREQMAHFLGQALEDAAASSSSLKEEVFDRATWRKTVELLRQSGGVAESEADELIRNISEALEPLERHESQLAIEFSRRIATDGEEKAIQWLRSQTEKDSAEKAQESIDLPQDNHPPPRNEVIRSRSRRLRGPPGR